MYSFFSFVGGFGSMDRESMTIDPGYVESATVWITGPYGNHKTG